jgi:hypothetical protein
MKRKSKQWWSTISLVSFRYIVVVSFIGGGNNISVLLVGETGVPGENH